MREVRMGGLLVALFLVLLCSGLVPTQGFALAPGIYLADTGAETIYYIDLKGEVGSNVYPFYHWEGPLYSGGPTMFEQDSEGNLLVTMRYAKTILRISPQGVVIETLPYHFYYQPYGIKYDASGNLYVSEYEGGNIYRILPSGEILTVVEGQAGWYGVVDLEFDDGGNLYASVYSSEYPSNPPYTGRILRIGEEVLRNFGPGSSPIIPEVIADGLNLPIGLAYGYGLLYAAESDPTKKIVTIVTVDPNTGHVETYYPPSEALDHAPSDIIFDENGNLYMSQTLIVSKLDTAFNLIRVAEGFSGFTRGILYVPPAPSLESLSPASVIAGEEVFILRVYGTDFFSGSVVRWNGLDRATTFINSTELSAIIPSTDIAVAGTADVTVFNPVPGGGTSNSLTFTVLNPVPYLTDLSPSSVPAGRPAFTLRVNGTGFVPGSVVRWNGSYRRTTFVSSTQLQAEISAANVATRGTASVSVFNPAPGGGTSNTLIFSIVNPLPIFNSLSPSSAKAGGQAFVLTVKGSGFIPESLVMWNGSPRATTFVSANKLSARISAIDIAVPGTANVRVSNPAPEGGISSVRTFKISAR